MRPQLQAALRGPPRCSGHGQVRDLRGPLWLHPACLWESHGGQEATAMLPQGMATTCQTAARPPRPCSGPPSVDVSLHPARPQCHLCGPSLPLPEDGDPVPALRPLKARVGNLLASEGPGLPAPGSCCQLVWRLPAGVWV